ncbi:MULTISPECIES: DUF11 domain-containing protein [unclassified Streptomyces]|uniref:DUF11 domain-containing protein n=1 Tax=unclassified Streptomyces TaxID=2593676 RepID=UPI000DACA9E0|nr:MULTISPECIES: DUF11 domain-containing protein [unclassified Streptomyces]PZT75884.1 hypothetical protein DNK56_20985 [Streptomyces sp. AC1-42W]PZT80163.1 hypothetical protein DNK55_11700 [Streptomyces sp. AC1-42T]
MGGPAGPARSARWRRLGGALVLLTPLLVAGSVSAPQAAQPAAAASDTKAPDTGRIVFAGTGHRSLGKATPEKVTEDLFTSGPAHYDQDPYGRGDVLVFTSLRDELRPQVYVRDAKGDVRRLTSGMDAAHPELSVDGQTVVFDSADDTGQRDLWSVKVTGGEPQRLTDTAANETSPTLSPDGKRIAYASDGGPEPGTQVYARDLAGGPVTCLSDSTQGDADEPEWNPLNDAAHRSRVVYTLHVEPTSDTDTGHRLRVSDEAGKGREVFAGLGADWGTRSAAWLPDGEGLYFLSPNTDCGCSVYDHVYRLTSIGGPDPKMVLDEDREVGPPAVLGPAGAPVPVVTRRTTKDAALVTLQDMRQDGSDPRDLRLDVLREDPKAKDNTSDDPADDPLFHPGEGYDPWTERQTYTPDGRQIAVTRFETDNGQRIQRIWLTDTEGEHAKALDLGRGPSDWDTDPAFSPDGTRLVFTRSTPGADGVRTSRVLIADVDTGRATGRVTGRVVPPADQVQGSDAQPAWSSDGTLIAFTRNQVIRGLGGIKHVWTAPVGDLADQHDLSATACPGECKVIDDSPAFSPDGASIAFNRKDRADQINQRASVVVTSPKGENCRVVLPSDRRDDPAACGAKIPDVETTGPYQPRDVAWSPDASRLVLSHRRGRAPNSPEQLSQLDLATGTLTPLTAELPGRQKEPAFQWKVDLTVTAPPTLPAVESGSSVDVTVTVTNRGPAPSPGTTFVADLPPGVRLEELTSTRGTCDAGTPTCDLGLLEPGARVEITARLTGVTDGPWQLGWSVTGTVLDPNPTDNATGTDVRVRTTPRPPAPTPGPADPPTFPTPRPPAPQPPAEPPAPEPEAGPGVVVRAQPSPGYVGGRVVVTYTVRNGKNAVATGLRLRLGLPARIPVDTLPAGCSGGVCGLADLAPGASSVLRVVLAPDRALRTTITATLTTSGTDADRGDNVSRIPLRILQPRIVSVPEVGKPGFVTSVRGKDFPPGVPVKLTWKPGITAAAAPTRPAGDGTFIAQLLIMVKDRTGPRTIIASGPGFSPVDTDFLVVTGNLVPPDEMGRR